jgi:glutamyl-tRNA reductase
MARRTDLPFNRRTELLLIGAGEMVELAATHFAAKPKSITVSNRTMERGEKLADRINAEAITLNEIPSGCTSSTSS